MMKQRRIVFFSLALGSLSALVACGHKHRFNPRPPIGALSRHPFVGKRLAIDLSRTPEEYRGRAGGHSFHIVGIRDHARHTAHSYFRNDPIVPDPRSAEVVMALTLGFRMSAMITGASCEASATWEIRTASNRVLARGSAKEVSSFGFMKLAAKNCEIAALKANAAALDNAFAQYRANPTPVAAAAAPPPTAPPAPAPPPAAPTPAPAAAPPPPAGPAPTPVAPPPSPDPAAGDAEVWHYAVGNQKRGPVSLSAIRRLFSAKEITAETNVWRKGYSRWMTLSNAPELASLVKWWYGLRGKKHGPVTAPQIRQLVEAGTLPGTTLVWHPGIPNWVQLRTLRSFAGLRR